MPRVARLLAAVVFLVLLGRFVFGEKWPWAVATAIAIVALTVMFDRYFAVEGGGRITRRRQ